MLAADLLTVRKHLEFYARIKGMSGDSMQAVVDAALVDMDLKEFEHRLAGTLSGGNKRKLSVAIAMIGDPAVVFLDEVRVVSNHVPPPIHTHTHTMCDHVP